MVSEFANLVQKWSYIFPLFSFFLSLQTIMLCIVGELAGEGFMAVADGVSEM